MFSLVIYIPKYVVFKVCKYFFLILKLPFFYPFAVLNTRLFPKIPEPQITIMIDLDTIIL